MPIPRQPIQEVSFTDVNAISGRFELSTIDDLRAFPAQDLRDGSAVVVLGESSAGDGGGNVYFWDSDATGDDDGRSVIAPNTGAGRWLLGVNQTVSTAAEVAAALAVAWWGDSLTAGTGGTPAPTQFGTLSGLSVYNGGVGGETSTQIKARMVAATSRLANTVIIWAGRNDYTTPDTVKANIAAMVAALPHRNFLVLSVINGSYGGYEAAGGEGYNLITQLNADLEETYGHHFVDVRSALVDAYDSGVPQDVTDHTNDIVPSSLRSDAIHLNTAGYLVVAETVLAALGKAPSPTLTLAAIINILRSPPKVGGTTANDGSFANLVAASLVATAIQASGLTLAGLAEITGSLVANGNGNSQPLVVKTGNAASAGGGLNYISSAGAEKWRTGLRDMASGSEGSDLIYGYFSGGLFNEVFRLKYGTGIQTTGKVLATGARLSAVVEYADNAAAVAGGLVVGDMYRTGDALKIVHA